MQLIRMSLVGTFVESNVAHDGKGHPLLLGLGAAGGPAAGLSWEVYNEGGHGACGVMRCWSSRLMIVLCNRYYGTKQPEQQ